jgi:hypothetical protein
MEKAANARINSSAAIFLFNLHSSFLKNIVKLPGSRSNHQGTGLFRLKLRRPASQSLKLFSQFKIKAFKISKDKEEAVLINSPLSSQILPIGLTAAPAMTRGCSPPPKAGKEQSPR